MLMILRSGGYHGQWSKEWKWHLITSAPSDSVLGVPSNANVPRDHRYPYRQAPQ